jgi:hypothetical protein
MLGNMFGQSQNKNTKISLQDLARNCLDGKVKQCLITIDETLTDRKPLKPLITKLLKNLMADTLLFVILNAFDTPEPNLDDNEGEDESQSDGREGVETEESRNLQNLAPIANQNEEIHSGPTDKQDKNECTPFITAGRTKKGCWRWTKDHCKQHPKMCKKAYLFGRCFDVNCEEHHFVESSNSTARTINKNQKKSAVNHSNPQVRNDHKQRTYSNRSSNIRQNCQTSQIEQSRSPPAFLLEKAIQSRIDKAMETMSNVLLNRLDQITQQHHQRTQHLPHPELNRTLDQPQQQTQQQHTPTNINIFSTHINNITSRNHKNRTLSIQIYFHNFQPHNQLGARFFSHPNLIGT